jgi:hypothetical protein
VALTAKPFTAGTAALVVSALKKTLALLSVNRGIGGVSAPPPIFLSVLRTLRGTFPRCVRTLLQQILQSVPER